MLKCIFISAYVFFLVDFIFLSMVATLIFILVTLNYISVGFSLSSRALNTFPVAYLPFPLALFINIFQNGLLFTHFLGSSSTHFIISLPHTFPRLKSLNQGSELAAHGLQHGSKHAFCLFNFQFS